MGKTVQIKLLAWDCNTWNRLTEIGSSSFKNTITCKFSPYKSYIYKV